MDAVAVSIGGSFLVGEKGVDVALAKEIAAVLERVAKTRRVFVVVGGGRTARTYIGASRELGSDEASLDDLGIAITRINARVLLSALPGAYPVPPRTFDEALLASRNHAIVVMGGTHPGHTTDAVAVMMAEKAKAKRLVIATNVDAVYSKDPNKHADAEKLRELTAERLVEITIHGEQKAGSAGVVDPLGAKLIARSRIETAVVHGRNLKALEAALLGTHDFEGSLVRPTRKGD